MDFFGIVSSERAKSRDLVVDGYGDLVGEGVDARYPPLRGPKVIWAESPRTTESYRPAAGRGWRKHSKEFKATSS